MCRVTTSDIYVIDKKLEQPACESAHHRLLFTTEYLVISSYHERCQSQIP